MRTSVRHPRHLGGVILPGDYLRQLKPVYARLAAQFEQRRRIELGDAPVAPLPEPDVEDTCASRAMRYPTLGNAAPMERLPPGCGSGHAPPVPVPRRGPRDCSRIG